MREYSLKLFECYTGNVKVKLDLFNYATKANFKYVTCVDTLEFAKKTDLVSQISNNDELGINMLKTAPVDP